jgi:alpha-beta hydrolase superfamily lysophospholipase
LALLSVLPGLDDADLDKLFMWGHSLGGEITLRTLLVDGSIRGASLWSPGLSGSIFRKVLLAKQ